MFISGGHNLIGDGNAASLFSQPGDQVIGAAGPGLGPLADNGGPTLTHALLSTSLALDGASASGGPATDQRGLPRGQDFDLDGVAASDIGAFELQAPDVSARSLVVDTLVDESDGDISLGDLSLREALAAAAIRPGPDVITFAPALTATSARIISLVQGQLLVNSDVAILGPGAGRLAVSGAGASRVMLVSDGN